MKSGHWLPVPGSEGCMFPSEEAAGPAAAHGDLVGNQVGNCICVTQPPPAPTAAPGRACMPLAPWIRARRSPPLAATNCCNISSISLDAAGLVQCGCQMRGAQQRRIGVAEDGHVGDREGAQRLAVVAAAQRDGRTSRAGCRCASGARSSSARSRWRWRRRCQRRRGPGGGRSGPRGPSASLDGRCVQPASITCGSVAACVAMARCSPASL